MLHDEKRAAIYRKLRSMPRPETGVYSQEDYCRIANAIGVDPSRMAADRCLDNALRDFFLVLRAPRRTRARERRELLDRVRKKCADLLTRRADLEALAQEICFCLHVKSRDDVYEGGGDGGAGLELLEALAAEAPGGEEQIRNAIRAVGAGPGSQEFFDSVQRIQETALAARDRIWTDEIDPSSELLGWDSYPEKAMNDFTAHLMEIYEKYTGKPVRRKVDGDGIPCADIIYFIQAVVAPLHDSTPDGDVDSGSQSHSNQETTANWFSDLMTQEYGKSFKYNKTKKVDWNKAFSADAIDGRVKRLLPLRNNEVERSVAKKRRRPMHQSPRLSKARLRISTRQ